MNLDRNLLNLSVDYDFKFLTDLESFTTRYIWSREQIINNEQQYYVDPRKANLPNPFELSHEGLGITAVSTPPKLLAVAANQPYCSGVLTTRDNGDSRLYGYWEGMIKSPNAQGAWPAFWLLPTHLTWPKGISVLPEIDIVEIVKSITAYHVSLHSVATGEMITTSAEVKVNIDLSKSYNLYGLWWDEQWIIWYFNDVEVFRLPTPPDMKTHPRHFLLNLAVGGNWPGPASPEDYPATMDIEYVRVYDIPAANPDIPSQPSNEDKALRGDVVRTLKNNKVVTKQDVGLMAEYLIEIAES